MANYNIFVSVALVRDNTATGHCMHRRICHQQQCELHFFV